MNKEKLKELLDNPELENLILEYYRGQTITVSNFIENKKKELEAPVYKTEDGYEIKERENIWYANTDRNAIVCSVFLNNTGYKQFLKKENAENYFVKKAEILSLEDYEAAYYEHYESRYGVRVNSGFNEKLKQKIRQKLGL